MMRQFNERYGRLTLIVLCLLFWGFIGFSFVTNGYIETWYRWHFPAKLPPFIDFRLIPSSAETFRSGIDPSITNTNDPMGHIFNYPKIWYLFFYTGISQADTIWICVVLIVLFFMIVFAFPEKITVLDSLLMLPVVFSSASMLLYERGNVDLAFFILCGLVVLLVERFPNWALAVFLLASMFKLFPFFGIGTFFRENKKSFFKLFITGMLIFTFYVLLNMESLAASWKLTQRGTYLSYGVYVIFEELQAYFKYYLIKVISQNQIQVFMEFAPHITALLCLLIVFWLGIKPTIPIISDSKRNLSAFRMGASIYIGTFLLGNNWDYRLAFLIFTVPQISCWMFSDGQKQKWLASGVFVSLIISCWYTVLLHYFLLATDGNYNLQFGVFDEMVNWLLFGGLGYLLTASAPAWFRSLSWNPFSQEGLPDTGRSNGRGKRASRNLNSV